MAGAGVQGNQPGEADWRTRNERFNLKAMGLILVGLLLCSCGENVEYQPDSDPHPGAQREVWLKDLKAPSKLWGVMVLPLSS